VVWLVVPGATVVWALLLLPAMRPLALLFPSFLWLIAAVGLMSYFAAQSLLVPLAAPSWSSKGWVGLWRLLPLALVAGVLGEGLMYPLHVYTGEPWDLARVGRAACVVISGGAVRAAVYLVGMVVAVRVAAWSRVPRSALRVTAFVALVIVLTLSALGWCLAHAA
jgi:hypothetical protein